MKKKLLLLTIFAMIIGALIILNPTKVFAANGPSDSFSYIIFYNDEGNKVVYNPETHAANNTALQGATYDKATNTLTLSNLVDNNLSLEINEMGDDFKIKLVGTNSLKVIYVWGFGYGGSLRITGNGKLDVHAEEYSSAIILHAEESASKLVIDSTATVNLYAGDEVIFINETTISSSKSAISLPNATSTGTNSVKLADGKTYTFEVDTDTIEYYKNMLAFVPSDYASTYTIFTNSKDAQGIYAGQHYSSISTGGKEYNDVWKIWKFIKSGNTYYQTTNEWDQYAIVEEAGLASSEFTKTANTLSTNYADGPQYIDIAKDSSNKQYALEVYYTWDSELGESVPNYTVYNIGSAIKINGEDIYILTENEAVDGSKLTRTVEKTQKVYSYVLPVKELKLVGQVALPFTDVKSSNWFYSAVKYVYENKIMSGTSSTTFAPNNKLTRAMMATILYNMAGSPAVAGTSPFSDVTNTSAWYYKAVLWAAKNNVVSGNKDGTFKPSDNITREQLAVMLYNYAKLKGKDLTKTDDLKGFSDANKVASYALKNVKWAVANGVITGSNGLLNPKGNASRAEAASMIYKYCNSFGK